MSPASSARLPHGHKDVALAADHVDRHGEGRLSRSPALCREPAVELARERLGLLRVGVLKHEVAGELDCALVLEELLGEVEQEQLVDVALAGHLAHAGAPHVGERRAPRRCRAGNVTARRERAHPLGAASAISWAIAPPIETPSRWKLSSPSASARPTRPAAMSAIS